MSLNERLNQILLINKASNIAMSDDATSIIDKGFNHR